MARVEDDGLGGLDLAPVASRRTIQEGVYQQLSHALMTGRFNPGQMLTISSLSELVGTSHMPVREALRRLAAENALEVASTGSAVVPAVTRERLDDLCDARIVVECAATERVVPRVTRSLIRSLEHLAREHLEAGREKSIPAILSKNQEFHFAIYRASGSSVLVQLIEALWLRFGPYLRMLTQQMGRQLETGEIDLYTRHHYGIIEALKAGDAAAAVDHMREDIRSTQILLQPICVSASDLPPVR
jgi:DNA-binding GntR family transcriptional regulator